MQGKSIGKRSEERLEDWKIGRLEEWNDGRLEEWKTGMMEYWNNKLKI